MDRENFFSSIQDKSRFEESAGSKISDTRHHDSVITDRNAVTANGLDNARSIHDKLAAHKYAVADTPAYEPGTTPEYGTPVTPQAESETSKYTTDEPSGFRTETELHYSSGASSSLYQTQEQTVTPKTANRGQSYMAMLQSRETKNPDRHRHDKSYSRQDKSHRREESKYGRDSGNVSYGDAYKGSASGIAGRTTIGTGRVVGPYVSYGKYGRSNSVSIERSTGRYADTATRAKASFGRSVEIGNGKYITYSKGKPLSRTEVHVNAQRFKTYESIYLNKLTTREEMGRGLQRHISLDSRNRATQRLKRYRVSIGRAEDIEEGVTSYVTKKGTIIPSKIAQKAKGTEEAKAKTLAKLTRDQKTTYSKKTVGVKGASGKFKKKINSGIRNTTGKVRDAALGVASYKIVSDDESNAAVKAMLASGRASYQTARAVNRKVNNANAQKFFDKIKGKPTEKTSGKYAFKAKRGVSEATSKAARQKAQAEASKKLQQMNMLKKFRQAKAKEVEISTVFQEVKQAAIKVAKKLLEFARRNATIIISVTTFLVVFIVVAAGLSSCAMAFSTGAGTYMSGTSGSTDYDISIEEIKN